MYFILNSWRYHSKGVIELFERTQGEERILFDCDIRSIKWPEYLADFCVGTHVYAMKESNIAPKYRMKKIMPSLKTNYPIRFIMRDVIKVFSKST
jgi:hypothetical protein